MPRNPPTELPPKPDDPEKYKQFLETADEVEASDDPKDFERALKMVVPTNQTS